jgi:restriction endonuclease BglII
VPRIVERLTFDGAELRTERLGLRPLIEEIETILTSFDLRVKEEKDANGGAVLRKIIDKRFEESGGWKKIQSGGVDWTKCAQSGHVTTCVGVEIQVSARSDLVIMDLIHLREAIGAGRIDLGVLLVPSDKLARFLTDRAANMSDAKKHIQASNLGDSPFVLMALEHDGPGDALPKQSKRRSGVDYPTKPE